MARTVRAMNGTGVASSVLAAEGHEYGTEHVKSCHEDRKQGQVEPHRSIAEAHYQNFVLAPETGKRPDASYTQGTDEECDISIWHVLAKSTHEPHVKRTRSVVDASCSKEEKALEESMIKEMEHTYRDTHCDGLVHVATLMIEIHDASMVIAGGNHSDDVTIDR